MKTDIRLASRILLLSGFFSYVVMARADLTPEEHASHHGGPPVNTPGSPAAPGGMGGPAAGGPGAGMAAGMGKMMEKMGKAPRKEFYPSLMDLPKLSTEQRAELQANAHKRMQSGVAQMNQGLIDLTQLASGEDYRAMQKTTQRIGEGLSILQSGLATHQLLFEGKAPRKIALGWFKREMSLVSPGGIEDTHGARGLSILHLFTMALLVAFAFAMLVMYYFKMRRATALFGRIDPDKGSPPPGSSPPQGGTPGPSGGKPRADAPPDNKSPSPVATDKPPAPGEPSAGKPSATSSAAFPLTAKWLGKLRVESIATETPSVQTFRLRPPDGGALPFTYTPGQFLNVAFGIGGARMNRSYSFSSSPHQRDYVELTIKREERGAVSRHILDLIKVGDEIESGGPVGKFTFNGTEAESIVLLSSGIGITPMMSIARYLTEQSWPGDIFFIYSCRTAADFIFQKPLAALEQRNPKLHVVVTMTKAGPDWKGPRGHFTKELLNKTVPGLAARRIHLCGPPAMMDSTKALLTELGVPPNLLKTEAFGAVKPSPAAPGTTVKPTAPGTGPLVTFSKSNKSAKTGDDQTGEQGSLATGPGQTILELSEQLGIGIEFSCRVGTCGVCKVKMTSGEVDQEVQDALDEDDKKNNIILACQAKPKTEVAVVA